MQILNVSEKAAFDNPPISDFRERITHSYKLKTRFARLRATGMLTADEVASLLRVTVATVGVYPVVTCKHNPA